MGTAIDYIAVVDTVSEFLYASAGTTSRRVNFVSRASSVRPAQVKQGISTERSEHVKITNRFRLIADGASVGCPKKVAMGAFHFTL